MRNSYPCGPGAQVAPVSAQVHSTCERRWTDRQTEVRRRNQTESKEGGGHGGLRKIRGGSAGTTGEGEGLEGAGVRDAGPRPGRRMRLTRVFRSGPQTHSPKEWQGEGPDTKGHWEGSAKCRPLLETLAWERKDKRVAQSPGEEELPWRPSRAIP